MPVSKPAAAERQRISMKLDNFSAGGVLPEGDYHIESSRFGMFTYQTKDGQTGATTTAFMLTLNPVVGGKIESESKHEQMWSVGSPEFYTPSEDGAFLEATVQTLSKNSNFYIVYENLVNAGLPEDKWDEEGAPMLVGMIGHIVHLPAPERTIQRQSAVGTGSVQQQPQSKSDFKKTIPVFKTILVAPWDKSKKAAQVKSNAAAKTGASKQAAKVVAPEPEPEAEGNRLAVILKEVVMGNGGKIGRTKARLECHKTYNKQKIDAGERDSELAIFNDDSGLNDLLTSIDCLIEGSDIVHAG